MVMLWLTVCVLRLILVLRGILYTGIIHPSNRSYQTLASGSLGIYSLCMYSYSSHNHGKQSIRRDRACIQTSVNMQNVL